MKHLSKITAALALGCMFGGMSLAFAQDNGESGPPRVLVINREYLKPGRAGTAHEKTESAFLAAAKAHKAPFHYLGMTSMSGPDRALFWVGFPSFAAWEAENQQMDKIPGLGTALDHAMLADGDLLSETDSSVWVRRDDMSKNSGNLLGARYFELELFKIKPGHDADWEALVKLVKDAYTKGVPGSTWTMFEQVYGTGGNSFMVVTPLKSLAEVDAHFLDDKKFLDALGKDGVKKLQDESAAAIESSQTNLFHFSPAMSLPPASWIAAEPDYWTPKPPAPAKKPEPKK